MMPSDRPQLPRSSAALFVQKAGGDPTKPVILARRGYYRDLMGVDGVNDRAIYDDAMWVLTPRTFRAFNANTDPSRHGGRLAVLEPGIYRYKHGIHHPGTPAAYPCLVQAGDVTVRRDNGVVESGEFYIHIHRGGHSTTSSEGCQTIAPSQWDEFYTLVAKEMAFYQLHTIPYVLTERLDR